jgi:DNA (cytosine-5)-methyltransferase 3A
LRAGINCNKYYASEIDKYAIKISQKNHPGIIQLGDINNWQTWNIDKPDIIIGGSPCQGFSIAGKRLNFEDPRSKLFFTFVDILNYYKPKYFLLENVKMKKEYQQIITNYLKVSPVKINSSLLSAQNRERLYWTNIPNIAQPENKNIYLKDIVFQDCLFHNFFPICLHNLYRGFNEIKNRVFIDKSPTIRTASGGGHIPSLLLSKEAIRYMDRKVNDGRTHWDFGHHFDVNNSKSSAVVANFYKGVPYNVLKDWNCIRKFDPIECERLQTMPDNYTQGVSNTQRYKMIGNGWTIDIISHILKEIKKHQETK